MTFEAPIRRVITSSSKLIIGAPELNDAFLFGREIERGVVFADSTMPTALAGINLAVEFSHIVQTVMVRRAVLVGFTCWFDTSYGGHFLPFLRERDL